MSIKKGTVNDLRSDLHLIPSHYLDQKLKQAEEILREKNISAWLIFFRSTEKEKDPSLRFLLSEDSHFYGGDCAIIITSSGDRIAIVQHYDRFNIPSVYNQIITYDDTIKRPLIRTLNKVNPKKLAINYSQTFTEADGLSYGMWLRLNAYLSQTRFISRLISSEDIMTQLQGIKLPFEIKMIKKSIEITQAIFDSLTRILEPKISYSRILEFLSQKVKEYNVKFAYPPVINIGQYPIGTNYELPITDNRVQKGDILTIDFGVNAGYCADLQRMWYFKNDGETNIPDTIDKAFKVVVSSLSFTAEILKEGSIGWNIDNTYREFVRSNGFEPLSIPLGHQLGQYVHEGNNILAPKKEVYGLAPYQIVKKNQTYSLEPSIFLPNIGLVCIEENVLVKKNRSEFLSKRQVELTII